MENLVMQVKQDQSMSFEQFLEWVAHQEMKHEYVNGEIYAMAGARVAHGVVSGNLYAEFRNHFRGTPCRAFIADLMVRVEEANCGFYPDVLVTCESLSDDDLLSHMPKLVVEVLSPSTERYDKDTKFYKGYRLLPSLEECVLVDTGSRMVYVHHKIEADKWLTQIYQGDAAVELKSIGLTLPLAVIFEGLS